MERINRCLKIVLLLMMAALTSAVSADGIIPGAGAVTEGNQVYFGTYNGKPVLWRVMGTGNTGSGMLLLSEFLLDLTQFNPDNNAKDANVWQGSTAQEWCGNFYSGSFTSVEQSSVIMTSKTDAAYDGNYANFGTSSLENEYVFVLSAEEAETYFSIDDDDSRKAYFEGESYPNYWWLRSPYANYANHAGSIFALGHTHYSYVDSHYGARPAFNLDLERILFASAIVPGKYKLSLKDPLISVNLTGSVTKSGNRITIPYETTGNPTQVSVIMIDGEWSDGADVKYYGELDNGSFILPDGYDKNWNTYLVPERIYDDYATNYAGLPLQVELSSDISVSVYPQGGGSAEGGGDYDPGQNVTLTARPAEHYSFVNWTEGDNIVSTDNPYNFTAAGSRSLTANFELIIRNIAVSAGPLEGGTVDGGSTYMEGNEITVRARPAKGYRFVNWTENGQVVSTNPDYGFVVVRDRELTANFEPLTYTLSVTAPELAPMIYGYEQPAARALTITNTGNTDAVILSAALSGTDAGSFILTEGTPNVKAGETNTTYTIRPKAGLDADTHTAEVIVTYTDASGEGDRTASSARIEFTVTKKTASVTALDQTINEGSGIDTGVDQVKTSGLLEGHSLISVSLTADGDKIVPSNAEIQDENSSIVTNNYEIDFIPGTLTVRAAVRHLVTFIVQNGAWNDQTSDDKEITLTGYEGETLRLDGNDIPGVGNAPAKGYQPGSWDVVPEAGTEITEDTAFVYSYAEMQENRRVFYLLEGRELPATGITGKPGKQLKVNAAASPSALHMRLQIPTLNVEADLVSLPLTEGSWNVEGLGDRAGLLEGCGLPGEGTAILAGHNTLSSTDYGPFALLSTLDENDLITVNSPDGAMRLFRVYANELLKPDDSSTLAAIAGQEANTLILTTCENESVEGGYLDRRVIFARPVL